MTLIVRIAVLAIAAMLGSIYYAFSDHSVEHAPGFTPPPPQQQAAPAAPEPFAPPPAYTPPPAQPVAEEPAVAPAPEEEPVKKPVMNMPAKIAKIMNGDDWHRVKIALYEQHIEDMSQSVEWFDGRTLARGDIAWESAELDKNGCRRFIVTRFADSRKEKSKTASIALCPNGKIH